MKELDYLRREKETHNAQLSNLNRDVLFWKQQCDKLDSDLKLVVTEMEKQKRGADEKLRRLKMALNDEMV